MHPSTTFLAHDINEPFPPSTLNAFDLTHVRYTLPTTGPSGLAAIVRQVVSTVKPGGWLQIHELSSTDDGVDGNRQALKVFITVVSTLPL